MNLCSLNHEFVFEGVPKKRHSTFNGPQAGCNQTVSAWPQIEISPGLRSDGEILNFDTDGH